jgi:hypothetical protein
LKGIKQGLYDMKIQIDIQSNIVTNSSTCKKNLFEEKLAKIIVLDDQTHNSMMSKFGSNQSISYVKAIKMIMKILSTGYNLYHVPDEVSK